MLALNVSVYTCHTTTEQRMVGRKNYTKLKEEKHYKETYTTTVNTTIEVTNKQEDATTTVIPHTL